jgi:predicted Fe-Mo cluster-binding NifX family protein
MLIAIPTLNNRLDSHFGHCKKITLIKVDFKEKKILLREDIDTPPHQPGLLPTWLKKLQVDLVIASGMGEKAKELLANYNIEVLLGAKQESPEKLVEDYFKDTLMLEENCCDH